MRGILVTVVLLSFTCPAWAQRLDTWNTKARERSQVLNSAALTALTKRQDDQAISLLMQATAVDPNDPIPLNTLAIALARQGKYDEALDALQKSYKLEKSSAETLLTTGFIYYLQHDWDAALTSWEKALKLNQKMHAVNALMGFAYLRKGDFARADELFHDTIQKKPNSHLAYQGLVLEKYLAGELTEARRTAEHAESISTYHPVILMLAAIELLEGNKQGAKQQLRNWTKATGKKAPPRSMTHIGYPVQHDFQWDPLIEDDTAGGDAMQAAAAMIPDEKSKKTPAKSTKVAALVSRAENKAQAAADDFYLRHQLGVLRLAAGDYTTAVQDFTAALSLCQACKVDWLYLARAQALAGNRAEASYAIAEYKRHRPQEKIAADLTAVASTTPAARPPAVERKPVKKQQGETGF